MPDVQGIWEIHSAHEGDHGVLHGQGHGGGEHLQVCNAMQLQFCAQYKAASNTTLWAVYYLTSSIKGIKLSRKCSLAVKKGVTLFTIFQHNMT